MKYINLLLAVLVLAGCDSGQEYIKYSECDSAPGKLISYPQKYEAIFRDNFSVSDIDKQGRIQAINDFKQIRDIYQKCMFQYALDGRDGIEDFKKHMVDIQEFDNVVKLSLEDETGKVLSAYQELGYFKKFLLLVGNLNQ